MSTITTEARQFTLDRALGEDQIIDLRTETGTTCWWVKDTLVLVESSSTTDLVDFSSIISALVRRGIKTVASQQISRMVLPV